jgi:hypothetical protein
VSGHTPEPWGHGPDFKEHPGARGFVYCDDSTGSAICDCNMTMALREDRAVVENARRIAACVNACRGLDIVELEEFVKAGHVLSFNYAPPT